LQLPVSVPAHSSLMRVAGERLQVRLAGLQLAAPVIPYVSAVDAAGHTDPEAIRALLVRQIASPVRWTNTVLALTARGATVIAECGPGKVLTALNKRIDRRPGISCVALDDPATIEAALAATRSA
jgi:[acyl-carrier-protein] S-malonyltransferase